MENKNELEEDINKTTKIIITSIFVVIAILIASLAYTAAYALSF